MLATTPEKRLRDATKAIQIAHRAVVLTNHRSADALDALAAAYAEAGQFDRAIDTIQEALRLGVGTPAEAAMLERKAMYERHRPYRQSSDRPNFGSPNGAILDTNREVK